jgi:hypothetical protein
MAQGLKKDDSAMAAQTERVRACFASHILAPGRGVQSALQV